MLNLVQIGNIKTICCQAQNVAFFQLDMIWDSWIRGNVILILVGVQYCQKQFIYFRRLCLSSPIASNVVCQGPNE